MSKEFWERLKTVATLIGAIGTSAAAISGFWPQVVSAAGWLSSSVVSGPEWLKYLFLALAVPLGVLLYFRLRHPPSLLFSVLECRIALRIHDAQATKSTLTESTHIRAELDGADAFTHRQWGDGSADPPNIWADGYRSSVKPLGVELGLISFAHEFKPPLRRGKTLWQHYECEFKNAFPAAKEYFDHMPPYVERQLCIEVEFPAGRAPTKVRALHILGEGLREHRALSLAPSKNGGTCAVWNVGRSNPGRKYRVEWEW